MQKINKISIFVFLVFISGIFPPLFAQNGNHKITGNMDVDSVLDLIDSMKEKTASLEFANDYTNKVVYWGRDFGLKQYGYQPQLTYKNGKGLFLYASGYYWSGVNVPIAKSELGIGFEKQFNDWFYASASYEKWNYYIGPKRERNALKNMIDLEFNFDLNFISIEPTVSYMFGNRRILQTDIVISGDYQLMHFFRTGRLFLQPELLFTYGNATFQPINVNSQKNTHVNQPTAFHLLDCELMIPLTFKYKNIFFKPAYHFAYPVKVRQTEILSPFSYYTITLSYQLFVENGHVKKFYKDL